MGIICCFYIRDHPSEIEHDSASSDHRGSEFHHSIFEKVKNLFDGDELHLTYSAQQEAAFVNNVRHTTEGLNTSSRRPQAYAIQTPPEAAVILDKSPASNNAGVIADILNTNLSVNHLKLETEHQSSDVILDEAAASVNERLRTETLYTNPSIVEGEYCQSSEQNHGILQIYDEVFPSSDEEDVCPTCLEDYEPDNPRIVAECSHHFHLSCIYDWMERSETCPICLRLMVISEN